MLKQFKKRLTSYLHNLLLFSRTDMGAALVVTSIWQTLLTCIGFIVDTHLNSYTTGLFADTPEGLFGHTLRWDSGWYMEIIHSDFYQHTSSQGGVFAFYPLYPALVALIAYISFGLLSLQAASFIVTTIAVVLSLVAIIRICRHFTNNPKLPLLIAILFIASPAAMFMHAFYSEAVFIVIGLWAYLFTLERRWARMAILLAILSAARLPAVLFITLCGLEYLRTYGWNMKKSLSNVSILWFLVAPLGFITYSYWAYIVSGDFLAMFHAYKAADGWLYQVFNPNILQTITQSIWTLLSNLKNHGINKDIIVNGILPIASIFVLFITSLYAAIVIRGRAIPLGVFGFLSLIMFTLNSNVVSLHRYSLACVSIFIAVAIFLANHKRLLPIIYPLMAGCFVVQIGLLVLFVTGNFAG